MSDRPLAAAAERLRGRPGRPRKAKPEGAGVVVRFSETALKSIQPRLIGLEQSALYLGLSPWTVRDLEAAGILKRVRVPLQNGAEVRKLLFDRADLDRLIEAWKGGAE